MKQNKVSPRDINHSPVWTIPISDEDPPSYNHFIASHFDISNIPTGAVLHYSDVIPYQEPSKATIKRKNSGVFSVDSLIDKNPDQLWLYFMTYLNEKPRLIVTIAGHHIEVKHFDRKSLFIFF